MNALCTKANIDPQAACGIEEYKKFQEVLFPKYVIKVHQQHGGLLFPVRKVQTWIKIVHVYHHNNHFDCIVSITGYLAEITTASSVIRATSKLESIDANTFVSVMRPDFVLQLNPWTVTNADKRLEITNATETI